MSQHHNMISIYKPTLFHQSYFNKDSVHWNLFHFLICQHYTPCRSKLCHSQIHVILQGISSSASTYQDHCINPFQQSTHGNDLGFSLPEQYQQLESIHPTTHILCSSATYELSISNNRCSHRPEWSSMETNTIQQINIFNTLKYTPMIPWWPHAINIRHWHLSWNVYRTKPREKQNLLLYCLH